MSRQCIKHPVDPEAFKNHVKELFSLPCKPVQKSIPNIVSDLILENARLKAELAQRDLFGIGARRVR